MTTADGRATDMGTAAAKAAAGGVTIEIPAIEIPASEARAQRAAAGGWIVPLLVLIVGSFMSVLDSSIVNVAIPKIQVDFGASAEDVAWVVTGYTLAFGVVVPVSGWLGLRIGQTRLYVLSILGFAAGSALCGLAWNLDTLIAFRIVQAIGGASCRWSP